MIGLRSQFKRSLETILSHAYAKPIGRHVMAGRTLVLAYHNICPDDADVGGDVSLHLPRRAFAEQLELLQERCDVIPLTRVREAHVVGARPRVVITFDDAYSGALMHGVPELIRRRLPATIFVAPGLLGHSMWWDEVAAGMPTTEIEARRANWLSEFAGDGDRIRRAAGTAPGVARSASSALRSATESELAAIAAQPGITIGSHSWSHVTLSRVSGERLDLELRESRQWLEQRFSSFIPWLAYPYGHYSDAVAREAQRAGYDGALAVDGGWMAREASDSFQLPRFNVPRGLSLDGFVLRLAGLFC